MTEYRITEQDFTEASYFALRKPRHIMYGIVLLVPLIIPLAGGFTGENLLLLGMVWAGVVLLLIFLEPVVFRYLLRRIYRKNPVYHRTQQVSISEDGIWLRSKNGSSNYEFSGLNKIKCHKDLFLIYPATTYYHVVPAEALGESEIKLLERYGSDGR